MQTVTIDPLRWQAAPSRVILAADGSKPAARLQVTAPRDVAGMARGRPVEELPRILAILGPAHHLVGAQALDQLFGVQAPPPAVNMRRALLETLFFSEHLQKIYFLLTASEHPFRELRQAGRGAAISPVPGALPDDLMHALALAQEGAAMLGGRSAHPLTAIAGGVSRQAASGAAANIGDTPAAGEPYSWPLRAGVWLDWYINGLEAALGAALALYYKQDSGEGQMIDVASADSYASLRRSESLTAISPFSASLPGKGNICETPKTHCAPCSSPRVYLSKPSFV